MKKISAGLLGAAIMLTTFLSSCKKDDGDSTENGQAISSLTDSTGAVLFSITYTSDKKPARIVTNDATFDFYYNNGKLVKRTQTGSVTATDSFFYDGNGRFSRVDNYDGGMAMVRSTVFAYNGDNTLNTATVNSMVFGSADAMYEFTYTGSNLNIVKEYEKVLGSFNMRRQFEFLAFDAKTNPLEDIITNYFPDQFNLLVFLMYSQNNVTSMKQTDYNSSNGNITGSFPVTATYTYNGNTKPSQIIITINGNTNKANYTYTTL